MNRQRSILGVAPFALLACSSSSSIPSAGSATVSGVTGLGAQSSARLSSGTGQGDGAPDLDNVSISFFSNAPGVSCTTLTSSDGLVVGMLEVDDTAASTLVGQTLHFGGSADGGTSSSAAPSFTFNLGTAASTLYVSSGSVTFGGSANELTGTFDVMAAKEDGSGATEVTGSFDAPYCGEY